MRLGTTTSAATYTLPSGSNLLAAAGRITRNSAWALIFPLYIASGGGTRGIIQIHDGTNNTIRIDLTNLGADIRAQIFQDSGAAIATRTLSSFPRDELVYVCLSNSGGDGNSNIRFMCARQNQSTIDSGNANYSTELNASRTTLVAGKQGLGTLDSFVGFIGPVVLRTHAVTPAELLAQLNRRAPGELITYDDNGTFDSHDQVAFALDGCGGTNPVIAAGQTGAGGSGTAGLCEEWSNESAVTASNLCIYEPGIDRASNTVYPDQVSIAGTVRHADIVAYAPGWFTEPNAPGSGGSTVVFDAIPAVSPAARMIVDDAPRGLVSYLGHGNSRMQGEYPADLNIPGVMSGVFHSGYHAGLMLRRWGTLAGQLSVRSLVGTGGVSLGCVATPVGQSSTGGTTNAANNSPWRRFGCGSGAAGSAGPGYCAEIALSSYLQHATLAAVTGTRFTADRERVFVGRFLAFPGAATVTPEARSGSAINNLGTLIATGSTLTLDTQIASTTVVSYSAGVGWDSDTFTWTTSPPTAVLSGVGLGAQVGDCVYFSSGGNEGLGRIATISEGGGNTTVTLRFEPRASGVPATGWTARVGPWAWRTTVTSIPANVNADAWIGVRWTAGASGSVPRIYCVDKFAVGDGFVIGGTGAGGQGGPQQLGNAHSTPGADGRDPFHAFLASHALPAAYGGRDGPDLMEFVDAEQTTDPAYRLTMTDRYRAHAPTAGREGGVAWWSPPVRGRSNGANPSINPDWDPQTSYGVFAQSILNNAATYKVLGCSSFASLGIPSSSYVRKMMGNTTAHFHAYFAYEAWGEKLSNSSRGWDAGALVRPDDDVGNVLASGERHRHGDRWRTRR